MAARSFASSVRRRWRFVAGVLLAVAALALVAQCAAPRTSHTAEGEATPPKAEEAARTNPPGSASPPGEVAAPSAEASRHRLRLLTFSVDADGPVLRESAVLGGRLKAAPRSNAPDRFEIVGLDARGEVVFHGAVPHPNHEWLEYPADDRSGRLEHTVRTSAQAPLSVRLPAEAGIATLRLIEHRYDANARSHSQRSFEFALTP